MNNYKSHLKLRIMTPGLALAEAAAEPKAEPGLLGVVIVSMADGTRTRYHALIKTNKLSVEVQHMIEWILLPSKRSNEMTSNTETAELYAVAATLTALNHNASYSICTTTQVWVGEYVINFLRRVKFVEISKRD